MKLGLLCGVIASSFLFSLPSTADEKIGHFTYHTQSDGFTDEDRSFIISHMDGGGAIAWGCSVDGLSVLLNVGTNMNGDADRDIVVRYRFDRNEPSEYSYWRLGTGRNDTAGIHINKVNSFTQEAINANQLLIEAIDPSNNESRRYNFSMYGVTQGLNRLSCYTRN